MHSRRCRPPGQNPWTNIHPTIFQNHVRGSIVIHVPIIYLSLHLCASVVQSFPFIFPLRLLRLLISSSSSRLCAFAGFLFLIFTFLSPSRDSYCFLSVQIRLIRPIRVLSFSPLTTSSSSLPRNTQYNIRTTSSTTAPTGPPPVLLTSEISNLTSSLHGPPSFLLSSKIFVSFPS